MRLPGIELLGIAPNWLLIWVVVWSVKRTVVQGAIAGLALGLLQDGMTSPHPTHALSLALVGILTARLQKQLHPGRYFCRLNCLWHGSTGGDCYRTSVQFPGVRQEAQKLALYRT